jgi:hypothetical protein
MMTNARRPVRYQLMWFENGDVFSADVLNERCSPDPPHNASVSVGHPSDVKIETFEFSPNV